MIQIRCTKKLLDYLNMPSVSAAEEQDSLFCFSANLITINRRKCIVVMNNETCCGFLLYGVTANDKKRFQKLLEAGLRNMLASENISEKVIDCYIADCSFPATLCKTANRSAVTRLNHFCQRIAYYGNCFDTDDRFQSILLPLINDDIKLIDNGKDCYYTFEKQEHLLRERYGKLYGCRAGVFDVSLKLETPCVRRVMIPMDFSLFYLHDVIQNLFLWQNCHLHEFVLRRSKDGRPLQTANLPSPYDEDFFGINECDVLDEREITLNEVFSANKSIVYEYDFGDGWTHEIRLIKMIDNADIPAPVCMELKGDAPPEDCGGPYGFSELVRILNDPKDPQHDDMVMWNGGSSVFQKNIKRINRDLRRRYLAGAFHLHYVIDYGEE